MRFFHEGGVVFFSTTVEKFDSNEADWTSTTSESMFFQRRRTLRPTYVTDHDLTL